MYFMKDFVVAVKCNGKILREQKDIVYMPFGKEYSLLLKNLSSKKASVSVEIDGQDVLNGNKLIINANSELELERYLKELDRGNKFKFVEFTEDIENHRGRKISDGIVRVEYRFEKYYKPLEWYWHPNIIYYYYPIYVNQPTIQQPQQYPQTTWISSGYGVSYGSNSVLGSGSGAMQSTDINNINFRNCNCNCNDFNDNGITVPGSISEQKFQQGYIGALENEVHVITLQLKGRKDEKEIKQPLTVDRKLYCVTCGKVNKSSDKFCCNCGTVLEIF